MLAFEQFPYAGLDFRHDPELVLPPGGAWGDIGMFFEKYLIFSNFKVYYFYDEFEILKQSVICRCWTSSSQGTSYYFREVHLCGCS